MEDRLPVIYYSLARGAQIKQICSNDPRTRRSQNSCLAQAALASIFLRSENNNQFGAIPENASVLFWVDALPVGYSISIDIDYQVV